MTVALTLMNVYSSTLCTAPTTRRIICYGIVWKIAQKMKFRADFGKCLQLDFVHSTNDVDVLYNVEYYRKYSQKMTIALTLTNVYSSTLCTAPTTWMSPSACSAKRRPKRLAKFARISGCAQDFFLFP